MADNNVVDRNKRVARLVASAQCSEASLTAANRAVDEHFAKDFVVHNTFPGLSRGADGTKQWNAAILEAVPDYRVTVDDEIAENDKVVTRWTARGTHKGEFQGLAPTGKQVSISGVTISRYVDGKIAESWVELDTLDLMRQLGAAPSRDPQERGKVGVTFNITING